MALPKASPSPDGILQIEEARRLGIELSPMSGEEILEEFQTLFKTPWPVVEKSARAVVDDGRRAIDAGASGHIFNLGHGVLPSTDPGLLTDLVALVHSL